MAEPSGFGWQSTGQGFESAQLHCGVVVTSASVLREPVAAAVCDSVRVLGELPPPRRDSNLRSCPVPPAGFEPALVSGAPGGIRTCARVRCPRRDSNLRSCPVPPAGFEPALVSGAPGGIRTCARVRCTQLGIVRTQTCR